MQKIVTLWKKDMMKRRYDEQVAEPWVECDKCGFWYHQICALYQSSSEEEFFEKFVCPLCVLENATESHVKEPGDDDVDDQEEVDGVENAMKIVAKEMMILKEQQRSKTTTFLTHSIEDEIIIIEEDTSGSDSDEIILMRSNSETHENDSVNVATTTSHSELQHCSNIVPLCAKSLPTTALSTFLESLVKELLITYGFEEVSSTITIRMTSNIQRKIEINHGLREFYQQIYQQSFSWLSKLFR
jgi:hypothetical protein